MDESTEREVARILREAYPEYASIVGRELEEDECERATQLRVVLTASIGVNDKLSDLAELYQRIQEAHHGPKGPEGCPCCAEFAPRMTAALSACSAALVRLEMAAAAAGV